MRRLTYLLAAGALVTVLAGCALIDQSGHLPPDRAAADARYYDPWGRDQPLMTDNVLRRE